MSRRKFVVTAPSALFNLAAVLVLVMIVIGVLFTVFDGPQHPIMYTMAVIICIPFILLMIKTKFFRVTVSGSTITVRKGLIRRFSCDVSNITKIDWKININQMGVMENAIVRVGRKKFAVETLMGNSDKFYAFLKENVDPDIIHERRRKLVKEQVENE